MIGTHLWWKSEKAKPGSTMARASQVRLVMAETEIIRAKFGDIPVFVIGDMNCEEDTVSDPAVYPGRLCALLQGRYIIWRQAQWTSYMQTLGTDIRSTAADADKTVPLERLITA